MSKMKLLRFLFILAIVLVIVFGIELFVIDIKDNVIGGIGLWCGLISQLLLAAVMFSEIRRNKKEEDS